MDLDLLNDLLNYMDWGTSSHGVDLRDNLVDKFILPRLMSYPDTFLEKCIEHFEGNIGFIISHITEDKMDFLIDQLDKRGIVWYSDDDPYKLDDIFKRSV